VRGRAQGLREGLSIQGRGLTAPATGQTIAGPRARRRGPCRRGPLPPAVLVPLLVLPLALPPLAALAPTPVALVAAVCDQATHHPRGHIGEA
jgi:hypothetical protein